MSLEAMSRNGSVAFEYLRVQNASERNGTVVDGSNSLECGREKHKARTRLVMQHLSRVKPEMMLKLLSSNKQSESEDKKVEIMELFPLSTGFCSNPRVTESNVTLPSEIGLTNPNSSRFVRAEVPEKLYSTSQFTIFHNGVVNVYDMSAQKVQGIMMLASANSSSNITSKISSAKIEEISGQQPSKSALNAVNENQPQKVAAGLEIVNKLSLQRFLQKRKARLNSVAPYSTMETATLPSKTAKDSDEQIILSLGCP